MNTVKTVRALLVSASLFLVAGSALATLEQNPSANVTFVRPDAWRTAQRGEVFLTGPADDSVVVEVVGHTEGISNPKAAGFDDGAAVALLAKSVGEIKLSGKVKEVTHNGMPGVEYFGVAKNKAGKPVDFIAVTLKTSAAGQGVTVVALATPGGLRVHDAAVHNIFRSVKKIK